MNEFRKTEQLLKHHLKKRQSITIALVIAFLITGIPFVENNLDARDLRARTKENNHIIPDTGGPNITKSANNTDVINIKNPNSNGISHNKFNEFNVGTGNNVIFNNNATTKDIVSNTGGLVQKNTNLSVEASTILNEVNGAHSSNINGAIEIAGKKADFILANENGINLNGASFINTNGVTLTTGKVFEKDNSIQFEVKKGNILLNGVGTSGDYFNVLSQTIELHNEISPLSGEKRPDITMISGNNILKSPFKNMGEVQLLSTQESKLDKYGIHADKLGAMYGKNIRLISTGDGLGVKHEGSIFSEKDIIINAKGDIFAKNIVSEGNLNITGKSFKTSKEKIQLNKKFENMISAKGDINLNVKDEVEINSILQTYDGNIDIHAKDITNRGIITTNHNLKLLGKNILNEKEAVIKGADLDLEAESSFINKGDIRENKKELNEFVDPQGKLKIKVTSGVLENYGNISAKKIELLTQNLINSLTGKISAIDGDIVITTFVGDLINSGEIFTKGNISITSNKNIVNKGKLSADNLMVQALQGNFLNAGNMNVINDINIKVNSLINAGSSEELERYLGEFYAYSELELKKVEDIIASLEKNSGANDKQDVLNYFLNIKKSLIELKNELSKTGTLGTITSKNINISGKASIKNSGVINSTNKVEITGNTIENTGVLQSEGKVLLKAIDKILNSGRLTAKNDITIDANSFVSSGDGEVLSKYLELLKDFDAKEFESLKSEITQLEKKLIESNDEKIKSELEKLRVRLKELKDKQSKITTFAKLGVIESGNIVITTKESLVNNGIIISQEDISLSSKGDIENNGTTSVGKNLMIKAQNFISKNLSAGEKIIIDAKEKFLSENLTANDSVEIKGSLINKGNLSTNKGLTVSGDVKTEKGSKLSVKENIKIDGGADLDGDLITNGDFTIDNSQKDFSNKGNLEVTGNVNINAKNIENNNATIGGNLVLTGKNSINNTGKLQIKNDTIIKGNNFNNYGEIISGNNFNANLENYFKSKDLNVKGNLNIQAEYDIDNTNNITVGKNTTLKSIYGDITTGTLHTQGKTNLDGRDINVNKEVISSGVEVKGNLNSDGTISSKGDISVSSKNKININNKGKLVATEDIILKANGDITNKGMIVSNKNIKVKGNYIKNDNATIWASNDVELEAFKNIENTLGTIEAKGNMNLVAQEVINEAGVIKTGKNLTINANNVINKSYVVEDIKIKDYVTSKTVTKWDDVLNYHLDYVTVKVPQIVDNSYVKTKATISSGGDLVIKGKNENTSSNVLNESGTIASAKTIDITGNVKNTTLKKELSLDWILEHTEIELYWETKLYLTHAHGNSGVKFKGTLKDALEKGFLTNTGDKFYTSLTQTKDPLLNQVLSTLLGADWKNQPRVKPQDQWNKEGKFTFIATNAGGQIFAGENIHHRGGEFINDGGESGENKDITIKVGEESVNGIIFNGNVNIGDINDIKEVDGVKQIYDIDIQKGEVTLNGITIKAESGNIVGSIAVAGTINPIIFVDIPTGENGIFRPATPKPNGIQPMFETNIEFIDPNKFYGSDYFFDQIGYDKDKTSSVIGDAYYEYILISKMIQQGLGYSGEISAENMKSLLDNALSIQQELNLEVGKPLTPEQVNKLDKNIIWYVEIEVNGQKTLTPQIYFSNQTRLDIAKGQGSGGSSTVKAGGNIITDNTNFSNMNGNITADGNIIIKSQNDINNNSSGGVSGGITSNKGNIALDANGDVNIIGGSVKGDNVLVNGNNVNIKSTVTNDENGNQEIRDKGSIEGNNGIQLDAKKDINIVGGSLTASGTEVKPEKEEAGGMNETSPEKLEVIKDVNYYEELFKKESKDIIEGDAGSININAKGDVNIKDMHTTSSKSESQLDSNGNYSEKSSTEVKSNGSNILGSNVNIKSDKNVNIKGSNIGTNDLLEENKDKNLKSGSINIDAKKDVNIESSKDIYQEKSSYKKTSMENGLLTTKWVDKQIDASLSKGSSLQTGGNLNISSGNNVKVQGSDILSNGNTSIDAENNVDILDGRDKIQEKSSDSRYQVVGGGTSTVEKKASNSKGSNIIASGDFTINAKNDVKIVNGQINSSGNTILKAGNDISIEAGKNEYIEKSTSTNVGIYVEGSAGIGGVGVTGNASTSDMSAEGEINKEWGGDSQVGENLDGSNEKTPTTSGKPHMDQLVNSEVGLKVEHKKQEIDEITWSESQLQGDNITIDSGNKVDIGGGDYKAKNNINIVGKSVESKKYEDKRVEKNEGFTVAIKQSQGVSSSIADTINSGIKMDQAIKSGNGNTGVLVAQGVGAASNLIFNDLIGTFSKQSINVSIENNKKVDTSENITSMDGKNINIKSTVGDINLNGVEIKGEENISIDSKKDINITSAKKTSSEVGFKVDLEAQLEESAGYSALWGGNTDIGIGGSANVDVTKNNSIEHINSQIKSEGNLSLKSENDTNIKGGELEGKKDVIVNVGGNLNIESQKSSYDENSINANAGGNVSIGGSTNTIGKGEIGLSGGGGNLYKKGETVAQSGIKSGGNLNVIVGKDANIIGGVLGSETGEGKLKVSGNLNVVDIVTTEKQDGAHITVSGGFSGDMGVDGTIGDKLDKQVTSKGTIGLNSKNIEVGGDILLNGEDFSLDNINNDLKNSQTVDKEIFTQGGDISLSGSTSNVKDVKDKYNEIKSSFMGNKNEKSHTSSNNNILFTPDKNDSIEDKYSILDKPNAFDFPQDDGVRVDITDKVNEKKIVPENYTPLEVLPNDPIYAEIGENNDESNNVKLEDEPIYEEIDFKNNSNSLGITESLSNQKEKLENKLSNLLKKQNELTNKETLTEIDKAFIDGLEKEIELTLKDLNKIKKDENLKDDVESEYAEPFDSISKKDESEHIYDEVQDPLYAKVDKTKKTTEEPIYAKVNKDKYNVLDKNNAFDFPQDDGVRVDITDRANETKIEPEYYEPLGTLPSKIGGLENTLSPKYKNPPSYEESIKKISSESKKLEKEIFEKEKDIERVEKIKAITGGDLGIESTLDMLKADLNKAYKNLLNLDSKILADIPKDKQNIFKEKSQELDNLLMEQEKISNKGILSEADKNRLDEIEYNIKNIMNQLNNLTVNNNFQDVTLDLTDRINNLLKQQQEISNKEKLNLEDKNKLNQIEKDLKKYIQGLNLKLSEDKYSILDKDNAFDLPQDDGTRIDITDKVNEEKIIAEHYEALNAIPIQDSDKANRERFQAELDALLIKQNELLNNKTLTEQEKNELIILENRTEEVVKILNQLEAKIQEQIERDKLVLEEKIKSLIEKQNKIKEKGNLTPQEKIKLSDTIRETLETQKLLDDLIMSPQEKEELEKLQIDSSNDKYKVLDETNAFDLPQDDGIRVDITDKAKEEKIVAEHYESLNALPRKKSTRVEGNNITVPLSGSVIIDGVRQNKPKTSTNINKKGTIRNNAEISSPVKNNEIYGIQKPLVIKSNSDSNSFDGVSTNNFLGNLNTKENNKKLAELSEEFHKNGITDEMKKFFEKKDDQGITSNVNKELLASILGTQEGAEGLSKIYQSNIEINQQPNNPVSYEKLEEGLKQFDSAKNKAVIDLMLNSGLNVYVSVTDVIKDKDGTFNVNNLYSVFDKSNPAFHSQNIDEIRDLLSKHLGKDNLKLTVNGQVISLPDSLKEKIKNQDVFESNRDYGKKSIYDKYSKLDEENAFDLPQDDGERVDVTDRANESVIVPEYYHPLGQPKPNRELSVKEKELDKKYSEKIDEILLKQKELVEKNKKYLGEPEALEKKLKNILSEMENDIKLNGDITISSNLTEKLEKKLEEYNNTKEKYFSGKEQTSKNINDDLKIITRSEKDIRDNLSKLSKEVDKLPKEHVLKYLENIFTNSDSNIEKYADYLKGDKDVVLMNPKLKNDETTEKNIYNIYKSLLKNESTEVRDYLDNKLIKKFSEDKNLKKLLLENTLNENNIKELFDIVQKSKKEVYEERLNEKYKELPLVILPPNENPNILGENTGKEVIVYLNKNATLQEVFETLVHEMTHQDQNTMIESTNPEVKVQSDIYYLNSVQGGYLASEGKYYRDQPVEKEAFDSTEKVFKEVLDNLQNDSMFDSESSDSDSDDEMDFATFVKSNFKKNTNSNESNIVNKYNVKKSLPEYRNPPSYEESTKKMEKNSKKLEMEIDTIQKDIERVNKIKSITGGDFGIDSTIDMLNNEKFKKEQELSVLDKKALANIPKENQEKFKKASQELDNLLKKQEEISNKGLLTNNDINNLDNIENNIREILANLNQLKSKKEVENNPQDVTLERVGSIESDYSDNDSIWKNRLEEKIGDLLTKQKELSEKKILSNKDKKTLEEIEKKLKETIQELQLTINKDSEIYKKGKKEKNIKDPKPKREEKIVFANGDKLIKRSEADIRKNLKEVSKNSDKIPQEHLLNYLENVIENKEYNTTIKILKEGNGNIVLVNPPLNNGISTEKDLNKIYKDIYNREDSSFRNKMDTDLYNKIIENKEILSLLKKEKLSKEDLNTMITEIKKLKGEVFKNNFGKELDKIKFEIRNYDPIYEGGYKDGKITLHWDPDEKPLDTLKTLIHEMVHAEQDQISKFKDEKLKNLSKLYGINAKDTGYLIKDEESYKNQPLEKEAHEAENSIGKKLEKRLEDNKNKNLKGITISEKSSDIFKKKLSNNDEIKTSIKPLGDGDITLSSNSEDSSSESTKLSKEVLDKIENSTEKLVEILDKQKEIISIDPVNTLEVVKELETKYKKIKDELNELAKDKIDKNIELSREEEELLKDLKAIIKKYEFNKSMYFSDFFPKPTPQDVIYKDSTKIIIRDEQDIRNNLQKIADSVDSIPEEHLLNYLEKIINNEEYNSIVKSDQNISDKTLLGHPKLDNDLDTEKNLNKIFTKIYDSADKNIIKDLNLKLSDKLSNNQELKNILKENKVSEETLTQIAKIVQEKRKEIFEETYKIPYKDLPIVVEPSDPNDVESLGINTGNEIVIYFDKDNIWNKEQTLKEYLSTIIHETTHQDQRNIMDSNLDKFGILKNLLELNGAVGGYLKKDGEEYRKQPLEREAFDSEEIVPNIMANLLKGNSKENNKYDILDRDNAFDFPQDDGIRVDITDKANEDKIIPEHYEPLGTLPKKEVNLNSDEKEYLNYLKGLSDYIVNNADGSVSKEYIKDIESQKEHILKVLKDVYDNNDLNKIKLTKDEEKALQTIFDNLEKYDELMGKNYPDLFPKPQPSKEMNFSDSVKVVFRNEQDIRDNLEKVAEYSDKIPPEHLANYLGKTIKNEEYNELRKHVVDNATVIINPHLDNDIKTEENLNIIYNNMLKNTDFSVRKTLDNALIEKLSNNKELKKIIKDNKVNEDVLKDITNLIQNAKKEIFENLYGERYKTLPVKIKSPLKDDPKLLGTNNNKEIELYFDKNSNEKDLKEYVTTIIHELAHQDQNNIAKSKSNQFGILKDVYRVNSAYGGYIKKDNTEYKEQPIEKDAYTSEKITTEIIDNLLIKENDKYNILDKDNAFDLPQDDGVRVDITDKANEDKIIPEHYEPLQGLPDKFKDMFSSSKKIKLDSDERERLESFIDEVSSLIKDQEKIIKNKDFTGREALYLENNYKYLKQDIEKALENTSEKYKDIDEKSLTKEEKKLLKKLKEELEKFERNEEKYFSGKAQEKTSIGKNKKVIIRSEKDIRKNLETVSNSLRKIPPEHLADYMEHTLQNKDYKEYITDPEKEKTLDKTLVLNPQLDNNIQTEIIIGRILDELYSKSDQTIVKELNKELVGKLSNNKELEIILKNGEVNEDILYKVGNIIQNVKKEIFEEKYELEYKTLPIKIKTPEPERPSTLGVNNGTEIVIFYDKDNKFNKQKTLNQYLDTIIHETTHQDQNNIIYSNTDRFGLLKQTLGINISNNGYLEKDSIEYKRQPVEREAYDSSANTREIIKNIMKKVEEDKNKTEAFNIHNDRNLVNQKTGYNNYELSEEDKVKLYEGTKKKFKSQKKVKPKKEERIELSNGSKVIVRGEKDIKEKLKLVAKDADKIPPEHLSSFLGNILINENQKTTKENKTYVKNPEINHDKKSAEDLTKIYASIYNRDKSEVREQLNNKFLENIKNNSEINIILKENNITSENLKKLADLVGDEKEKVYKEIIGKEYSKANVIIKGPHPTENGNLMGNTLTIYTNKNRDIVDVFSTIIHEYTHNDQRNLQQFEHSLDGSQLPYLYNINKSKSGYINPESSVEGYKNQPLEKEAYDIQKKFLKDYREENSSVEEKKIILDSHDKEELKDALIEASNLNKEQMDLIKKGEVNSERAGQLRLEYEKFKKSVEDALNEINIKYGNIDENQLEKETLKNLNNLKTYIEKLEENDKNYFSGEIEKRVLHEGKKVIIRSEKDIRENIKNIAKESDKIPVEHLIQHMENIVDNKDNKKMLISNSNLDEVKILNPILDNDTKTEENIGKILNRIYDSSDKTIIKNLNEKLLNKLSENEDIKSILKKDIVNADILYDLANMVQNAKKDIFEREYGIKYKTLPIKIKAPEPNNTTTLGINAGDKIIIFYDKYNIYGNSSKLKNYLEVIIHETTHQDQRNIAEINSDEFGNLKKVYNLNSQSSAYISKNDKEYRNQPIEREAYETKEIVKKLLENIDGNKKELDEDKVTYSDNFNKSDKKKEKKKIKYENSETVDISTGKVIIRDEKEIRQNLKTVSKVADKIPKEHLTDYLKNVIVNKSFADTVQKTKYDKAITDKTLIKVPLLDNNKATEKTLSKIYDELYSRENKEMREKLDKEFIEKLDGNKKINELLKKELLTKEEVLEMAKELYYIKKFVYEKNIDQKYRDIDVEVNDYNPKLKGSYSRKTGILSLYYRPTESPLATLRTIAHELTHVDQHTMIDSMTDDEKINGLANIYYVNTVIGGYLEKDYPSYRKQPMEKEAHDIEEVIKRKYSMKGKKDSIKIKSTKKNIESLLMDKVDNLTSKSIIVGISKEDISKLNLQEKEKALKLLDDYEKISKNGKEEDSDKLEKLVKEMESFYDEMEDKYSSNDENKIVIEHFPNKSTGNLEDPHLPPYPGFDQNTLIYGASGENHEGTPRDELVEIINSTRDIPLIADIFLYNFDVKDEDDKKMSPIREQAEEFINEVIKSKGDISEEVIEKFLEVETYNYDDTYYFHADRVNVESQKEIVRELLDDREFKLFLKEVYDLNLELKELKYKLKDKTLSAYDRTYIERQINNIIDEMYEVFPKMNSIKTIKILDKVLENGGKIYFSLDGVTTSKDNSGKIILDRKKLSNILYNKNSKYYNTITSGEIRHLYNNHLDKSGLKFIIDSHVIATPIPERTTSKK